ncbi:MAG: hypothetical protein KME31_32130 [Tolypothrix carrinoi HA7290-LM1]|jgi:hypothetical protein|nr:hypothetical protein [Tolypothrix carrinoi HA7290-LM1]
MAAKTSDRNKKNAQRLSLNSTTSIKNKEKNENQANPRDNVVLTPDTEIHTTRPLTAEQIAQYHRDGYVIIRNFFDLE